MTAVQENEGPLLPRATERLLYACALVSGVAGLIYEVVWAKYLALFVGGTGLAHVIVLATFMGGMALGSHVLGRITDRVQRVLRLYAAIEVGIGVYALLFPRIFTLGRTLFLRVVDLTNGSAGGLVAAKVAACVAVILVPTFLMGGTMPALSRCLVRRSADVGPRVSRLYFVNSLGAVAGCLLAGVVLIWRFGLEFSMIVGGGLNILVGVVTLWVSVRGTGDDVFACGQTGARAGPGALGAAGIVVLVCVGLSGAVSMMYEVAWIRLLTLVLGSSTYSFTIMLATFILGLGLGGLLLSFRKRETGYRVIFGLAEVGVGLTILLVLPFYVRLPYLFNQVASCLSREPETFGVYQFSKFGLCALVMLVPTILQGITFPAATKILTTDMGQVGRRVGLVLAVNTVGTLAGAVFAGVAGLPALGIKGTLELAIALNGVLGLAVLWTVSDRRRRRRALVAAVAASAMVWAWYGSQLGQWDREVLVAGAFRIRQRIPSYIEFKQRATDRDTLFYRDGIDATVAVQDITMPTKDRVLVINGKVDASAEGDRATQKMLGHLGLLCHTNVKNVLVIGLGSGTTVGSVLTHDVAAVDVVELSREVIDASREFAAVNGRYWEDPRVRVVCEDAKTFLQVTRRQYDLIISEPSNPWMAGVAGVFSREYFAECRKRLAPDGLFVQWVQAYELEDAVFFMVLETFASSFPHYTLWNPEEWDTIIVGGSRPYVPDFGAMRTVASQAGVERDLAACGMDSIVPVLAMQMADYASGLRMTRWVGAQHSDFYPVLEYLAPRGFFTGSKAQGVRWIDHRRESPENARLWLNRYLESHAITSGEYRNCLEFILARRSMFEDLHRLWALEWAARCPDDAQAMRAAAEHGLPSHAAALQQLAKRDPGDRKLRCRLGVADYRQTRGHLSAGGEALLAQVAALRQDPACASDPDVLHWHGELLFDAANYRGAAEDLAAAAAALAAQGAPRDTRFEVGVLLCRARLAAGDAAGAAAVCRELRALMPGELRVTLLAAMLEAGR